MAINIIKNLPKLIDQDNLIDSNANTYLGNRGYCIFKNSITNKSIITIKSKLNAKPHVNNNIIKQNNEFPLYLESSNKLYIPRYFGIKYFGYPKSIKYNIGNKIDVKFLGTLRDYQTDIINEYLNYIDFYNPESYLLGKGGGSIEVGCGRGKTIMAIKLIEILKTKTRIIVHKEFLKNQWIERIKQFMPDAKIGYIQGQIIDIENKDIVLIMLQSLSQKNYPTEIFNTFGFTIVDECHHISSEVFSKALQNKCTQYSLALSATMDRKDGLTWVFKYYLGELIYREKRNSKDNVLIKAINFNVINDDDYNEVNYDSRGNVMYSTMITKICNFNSRSEFIINIIDIELKLNRNQQIILLSDRITLLKYIYNAITCRNICNVGFYIGGMKQENLKNNETCTLILATYSMASEALDIKSLTTLILATPKVDIIQASGRILREKHENPLIIDIIDQHEPFLKQFKKRCIFYHSNNYIIKTTDNNLYSLNMNDSNWKYIEKNKKKNKKEINNKCLINLSIS